MLRQIADSGGTARDKLLIRSAIQTKQTHKYLGKQAGWRCGRAQGDVYTGDFTFILDIGGDRIFVNLSNDRPIRIR
ncbi:MAG: hypothetical protein IPH75_11220 [bacterium]|nr:hypothetical protein [bacterium]